jgi:hypothetical protein
MTPEDREEGRRLAAMYFLWQTLIATKEKSDPVAWHAVGGPEAEAFLHALESGGQHPVLRRWEKLMQTVAANRPAPDLTQQKFRRNVVLMVEALYRAGLKPKEDARKRAVKALRHAFPSINSASIKYFQANYSLTSEDKWLIAQAIARHGHDFGGLANWFIGLIRLVVDPGAMRGVFRRIRRIR